MSTPLRLIIHASTEGSLDRARRNAANLVKARPDAVVRIVVNGPAVAAAIDRPDAATDRYLTVCGNTLANLGRDAAGLTAEGAVVVPAAVVAIAEAQADGWGYMRA